MIHGNTAKTTPLHINKQQLHKINKIILFFGIKVGISTHQKDSMNIELGI